MRKKQGFTLVELLVVMAIIAILAAIVVPNASKFIGRARTTRALAEVTGAETAITAMLTDAGRSSLNQVFGPGAVPTYVISKKDPTAVMNGQVIKAIAPNEWPAAVTNVENFKAIVEMYTSVTYDLLRYGRDVLRSDTNSEAKVVINNNLLSKLGTSYLDLGNDPWGGSYNIFPGPWKFAVNPASPNGQRSPIIFRKFSIDTSGNSKRVPKDDGFALKGGALGDVISTQFGTIVGDDAQTWPDKVGYPADAGKSVFIWSLGENTRSGQMMYMAKYEPAAANAMIWYTGLDGVPQDGADLGGGDDINNWDKDSTWSRFTNTH